MRAALALAITIFLASLAVGAQGGGGGAQQQPPPATPAQAPAQPPAQPPAPAPPPPGTPTKALVPIAASTLAANPEAYVGEFVSLTGTVEQSIGKMAFSVDQDPKKSSGKDVVVLMRHLSGTIDPQTYVTVIGQVVKYDPAEFAGTFKEWGEALPSDAASRYTGKPVVIATSVINVAGIDVMRRLPPPMTADEEAFQKIMKQVGSSNAALRKGMEASDVKLAAENAVLLRQSFTEAEAFWKKRSRNDAVTWAQDAKKLSDTIHRAAVAGKWDEVKASATTLGQTCQSCHTAHRERFDDGSFRIKKPTTK
jgi:cytochrome c556